jgi:hypothetical protein
MIPQARIEAIDETAIRQLLGVAREGRTLDFKEALDLSEAGRRALAEDVCAFANTVGGDLVFGIREQGGVADEIVPVKLENSDAALLQLTNALRDMVEPRVTTTLRSHAVRLAGGGHVIVLRVGLSPNAPHRVLRNNHFYLRNSVGKETMDIHAIRTAFAFADSLADRALTFRDRRLEALNAGSRCAYPTQRPPGRGADDQRATPDGGNSCPWKPAEDCGGQLRGHNLSTEMPKTGSVGTRSCSVTAASNSLDASRRTYSLMKVIESRLYIPVSTSYL